MDLLLLGGITLGLLSVAAIVLNARQVRERDVDLDRCDRCGAELNSSSPFLEDVEASVVLAPVCPACGAADTRFEWLSSRDWD